MALACCPVSDCVNPVPANGIICTDCYFLLERSEFSLLVRTRSAARRAINESDREHLQSQFEGYLKSVGKVIGQRRRQEVM